MYIPIWVIIVTIIIGFFYYKGREKRVFFSPFYIRIFPNWEELLNDYKFMSIEGWKKLREEADNDKTTGYNIFKSPISFTVLKSDENGDLIYNNNWKSFSTEVDFREHLQKDSPAFQIWVKWGIEGYEIGIVTPESLKKRFMVGDDVELIKITVLPYSLFHMPRKRFGVAKPDQIQEQLKKHGWSKDETHENFKKDVLYRVPEELNHKYFAVWYDYI